MSKYVATIDTEWEYFSEKHKEIWEGSADVEGIEKKLRNFLAGGKVNPIAIRGPIGQGKTQLLYTIFKFVWRNSGIALYATLDKLIPESETTAVAFADLLNSAAEQSIDKIRAGRHDEIPLLTDEMRQFLKKDIVGIPKSENVVFLIDEMERSYGRFLSKVKTDDRSPFGFWLEHTTHFPIAAFAPLSHYEALYGEAQKRRWDSISLPPVTAATLRVKDEVLGNFIWWVSRGRLGISYKAADSVKRRQFSDFNDFRELESEIGSIAGVPAIDLDGVAKLTKSLRFIVNLFPQTPVSLPGVVEGEIVDKGEFLSLIKQSLESEGWKARSIELYVYYLNMIADSLSGKNNLVIPLDRYEEVFALLGLGVDLATEHETLENADVKYIFESFRRLQDKFPAFFFIRLYSLIQKSSKGKGAVLSYREVANLFPMPITSPLFGGFNAITEAKELILSKSTYDYVGQDEEATPRGVATFHYFANEEKLKNYASSAEMMQFLCPDRGIVCVLLDGDPLQVTLSGVAAWLKGDGRFLTVALDKMLGNFLTYFVAWVMKSRGSGECINGLTEALVSETEQLWTTDKESARKADHYAGMLRTFIASFHDALGLDKDKYSTSASAESVRRYAGRYVRFPDIVGVAFIKSKDEHSLVYRFRKLLLDSAELKGMKSGIGGLLEDCSVGKSGLLLPLQNIRGDFEKELALLLALASQREIQEDDFATLSVQSEGQIVLKGIFRFVRNDTPPSALDEMRKEIESVLRAIGKLEQGRKQIEADIGISLRTAKSENNLSQIQELLKIIDDVASSSRYVRWLLSEFTKVILGDFKEQYLHPDQTTLSKWETRSDIGKNFIARKREVKELKTTILDWLGKNEQEVDNELNSGYQDALQTLVRYNRDNVEWEAVDSLEWSPFEEKVDDLIAQIEALKELDAKLGDILQLAQLTTNRLGEVQ